MRGHRRHHGRRATRHGENQHERHTRHARNVGQGERWTSIVAGSLLAGLGVARRDLTGALIGLAGGALVLRGATGHCALYRALGIDTTEHEHAEGRRRNKHAHGIEVSQSFTIDRPAEELYRFWRRFENLPQVMAHVERVHTGADGRSHWVVRAPRVPGGKVEWDAEVTHDEPGAAIGWRSLPGADVANEGSIRFEDGPRGTVVHVRLTYRPPAGRAGKWIAKVFGADPDRLIREDLRNWKRVMETGDILTTRGQPRGTCLGRGRRDPGSRHQPRDIEPDLDADVDLDQDHGHRGEEVWR